VGAAAADLHGVAADLADGLGGSLEEFGLVVHRITGAVGAAVFLIGEERHDEISRGLPAVAFHIAHQGQDHGVHVLHVHGAAAPDHAVHLVPAEGVHLPVACLGGHHIEVPVHHQGIPAGVGAGDAQHHAGAADGGFEVGGFVADLG